MRILAIETSCDETAIAIIDYDKKTNQVYPPKFSDGKLGRVNILANLVSSQIEIHKPFGGVVPNLARREHEENLVPILIEALKEAKLLNIWKSDVQKPKTQYLGHRTSQTLKESKILISNSQFIISKQTQNLKYKIQDIKLDNLLEREPILLKHFKKEILPLEIPNIDAIAVTYGPGLAPALWVGVNFAKALSYIWEKSLIPVNHMEGHIFSALLKKYANYKLQIPISKQILLRQAQDGEPSRTTKSKFQILKPNFPALALLVSGGHTELVLMKKLGSYKIIGETIDDAAGEAFDKVARILDLPYPGGPEISHLADLKTINYKLKTNLPRPMLHSKDFNFSFSGLKTAVLYLVRDLKKAAEVNQLGDIRCPETEDGNIWDIGCRAAIAKEFQDAVVEVLVTKTIKAAKEYGAHSIILGGGVAANTQLRKQLAKALKKEIPNSKFYIPNSNHTGDNALMIALAAAVTGKKKSVGKVEVKANLRF